MSLGDAPPEQVDKILVSLNYQVGDEEGLSRVVEGFTQAGYRYIEASLPPEQLGLLIPAEIVRRLREKFTNAKRIVLLSNVRAFALAWYRVFNGTIDDFVWFLDPASPAAKEQSPDPVVEALASFCGIESDPVKGKVYTNAGALNCQHLLSLMLQGDLPLYFDVLSAFEYDEGREREVVNKSYQLGGTPYEIIADPSDEHRVAISLDAPPSAMLDLARLRGDAGSMLVFFIMAVLEAEAPIEDKLKIAKTMLRETLPALEGERFEFALQTLEEYAELPGMDFALKVLLLGAAAVATTSERMATALVRHAMLHPADMLCGEVVRLLGSIDAEMSLSEDYHRHKSEVCHHTRVAWKEEMAALMTGKIRHRDGRVAVLLGALGDPELEPAKSTIVMINQLAETQSVLVCVTDTFLAPPATLTRDLLPLADESQVYATEHAEAFTGNVQLLYIDPESELRERAIAVVTRLRVFEPKFVWSHDCHHDVIRGLVYEAYPLVESGSSSRITPDPSDMHLESVSAAEVLASANALASSFDARG